MRKHNNEAYSNVIGTPFHETRKEKNAFLFQTNKKNESNVLRFRKEVLITYVFF